MPRQNRVTPFGDLVADPARGLVYGNRGCLHDAAGQIRRRFGVKRWISCQLEFRGWHRAPLMQPGRFTELFFLDEATAFAAGHRPCALCRRADYDRFVEIWRSLHPRQRGAEAMDEQLHFERIDPETRGQRRHAAADADLPYGAFVLEDAQPWLIHGSRRLRWTPAGYAEATARRPRARAVLLTPPSLVAVLASGWDGLVPLLHPSAARA